MVGGAGAKHLQKYGLCSGCRLGARNNGIQISIKKPAGKLNLDDKEPDPIGL